MPIWDNSQFFSVLSLYFLPKSVWLRRTWAPANGVEPSVTLPLTLASTACDHAGMAASANSRAATAAKNDFLFIVVKPSGFNSQNSKPCDSPHAPCTEADQPRRHQQTPASAGHSSHIRHTPYLHGYNMTTSNQTARPRSDPVAQSGISAFQSAG